MPGKAIIRIYILLKVKQFGSRYLEKVQRNNKNFLRLEN